MRIQRRVVLPFREVATTGAGIISWYYYGEPIKRSWGGDGHLHSLVHAVFRKRHVLPIEGKFISPPKD
jgi:hypothetical protein